MQYKPQSQKHTLTALLLLAALVVGFVMYDYSSIHNSRAATDLEEKPSPEDTTSQSPFSPQQLAMLAKIESLTLDGALFKDPAFVSLQDWTVPLGHEDVGRVNPFAPVGGLNQSTGSTTRSTHTPTRRR